MIYATPFTFASGSQGALFEKTAPLDPSQKLFINKRGGQANCVPLNSISKTLRPDLELLFFKFQRLLRDLKLLCCDLELRVI